MPTPEPQPKEASKGAGYARVGCSGWSYTHWRGTFYPAELRSKDWFRHYSGIFATVEVNNTFYRLPRPETFEAWAANAPPGFVYALKVSSFGTHRLKLGSPERWLPTYVERAILLGATLGPNLVQLPPRWKRDTGRLAAFLDAAAARPEPLRWAVELRDPSWLHDSTYQVLSDHQAALCWHDLLPDHPWLRTAGWTYARFHGPRAPSERYAGEYGRERLVAPARQLRAWLEEGCDVYAYFNNDEGAAAPRDASALARLLGSPE